MRGWQILILLILANAVFAATCTDSDNGGAKGNDEALKVKGDVKYGITSMGDTCLTAEEEGVSTNSSKWLKEYFCTGGAGGQRSSEIYDCIKLGFSGCLNGACNGSASSTQQQSAPAAACGNKIIEKEKGEECDPPDKICFGKTSSQYGICQFDCKCKIAATAEKAPEVCGDGTKDSGEDCEKDADCPASFVCSSCKCVKQLTAEEIEALKKNATVAKEEKEAVEDKYTIPELPEVNLTAKNFSEEPGIKAASGFANFFKKIFGWIAALFS